jgi:hypothetical protein
VQGNLHVNPFVISLTLDGFLAPDDPVRGLDILTSSNSLMKFLKMLYVSVAGVSRWRCLDLNML